MYNLRLLTKKIMIFFLIFGFLANGFLILPQIPKTQAQTGTPSLPEPYGLFNNYHLEAFDSGKKIQIYIDPVLGTSQKSYEISFNKIISIPKDVGEASAGKNCLLYSFPVPYDNLFLFIQHDNFQAVGVYYANSSNNPVQFHTYNDEVKNDTFKKTDGTVFSTKEKQYFGSFVDKKNVIGMTRDSVSDTTTSIDCEIKFGDNLKVAYRNVDQIKGTFKEGEDKLDRLLAGKPPIDAKIKLYWKPLQSPVYQTSDYETFDYHKDTESFHIKADNLKAGSYYLATYWAIDQITKERGYDFDNLEGREYLDALIRLNVKSSWTNWGTAAGAGLATAIIVSGPAAWIAGATVAAISAVISLTSTESIIYEIYGGASKEMEVKATPGEIIKKTCADFETINVSYLTTSETPGSGSDSACGPVNTNIMQWGFCEMLAGMQGIANWIMGIAIGWFETMTNIAGQKDVTPPPEELIKPTEVPTKTPTTPGGGTPTTATPAVSFTANVQFQDNPTNTQIISYIKGHTESITGSISLGQTDKQDATVAFSGWNNGKVVIKITAKTALAGNATGKYYVRFGPAKISGSASDYWCQFDATKSAIASGIVSGTVTCGP